MENRLTELEIKLSFMEDLVEDLNHTVYRQQMQIDQLQRYLLRLTEQIQDSGPGERRDLREEIPPHY